MCRLCRRRRYVLRACVCEFASKFFRGRRGGNWRCRSRNVRRLLFLRKIRSPGERAGRKRTTRRERRVERKGEDGITRRPSSRRKEGAENARGGGGGGERGLLEWESGGGSVRVGVRNRLGEAIGKPVANLHGRWTSAATVPREKGKKGTPVLRFSADRSTYPVQSIFLPFFFPPREWRGSGRGTKDRKVFVRKMCFESGGLYRWITETRSLLYQDPIEIRSMIICPFLDPSID